MVVSFGKLFLLVSCLLFSRLFLSSILNPSELILSVCVYQHPSLKGHVISWTAKLGAWFTAKTKNVVAMEVMTVIVVALFTAMPRILR